MKWNDPQFIEAIRLIRKFFPESKGHVYQGKPLSIESLVASMRMVDYKMDFSGDPYGVPEGPDLGFNKSGGFEGADDKIYSRILRHIELSPTGRVVIVPDAVVQSKEDAPPFVCHSDSAPSRLREIDNIFSNGNDSLFIYESGEAFAVDHDNRLFWAKSKINI
ncbi:hypothetical protein ACJJIQ_13980 [Microbulbifer sp. ANSA003]|uniref:hypothetical protein n=1 Tax=Microbulbifer sp. ANSA003 TaxID=3243360 RepID=UPI004042F3B6